MKSACFTGHRNAPDDKQVAKTLEKIIVQLIEEGVTHFYAGNARGWDYICERTVMLMRNRTYDQIRLHLLLPCSEEEQMRRWKQDDKKRAYMMMKAADCVELLSNEYYDGCMKVRNQELVDRSDVCICYYNERRFISGTGQTVRMAQKKGIPVINVRDLTNEQ
ncbi:MAG: DUF1273 family protein [Ruminococcus sp.]|nr:DUF1273 family protein [Ruminococcus sp.]